MVDREFLDALNSTVEIELSVKGRRSGRNTSRPVWFVLEGRELYLLPVAGSETEWYRNVLTNPEITLSVKEKKLTAQAKPLSDPAKIAEVVDRFRQKHGVHDVQVYYTKLDAAVAVSI
jgi:hypothetical protein